LSISREDRGQNVAAKDQIDRLFPHIISPCGRCREFIRQIHPDNVNTEVILDTDKTVKLVELLPRHDWFQKI